MKSNKKYIIIAIIIVVLAGASFVSYKQLKKSYWAFTPAFSQRQVAGNFLNDVYANKMSAAYAYTSNAFLKKNSITDFGIQESVLANKKFKTTFGKYYVTKNSALITGLLTNLTNGSVYSLTMTFVNNKVDSIVVMPVN